MYVQFFNYVYTMSCLVFTNICDNKRDRKGDNKPELRQKLIYDVLSPQYQISSPPIELTDKVIIDLGVHSSYYLDFLKNAHSSFLAEEKQDPCFITNGGLVPYHFTRRKSFQSFMKLPYWKQCGYFADDILTPIYNETYDIAMRSANNVYMAAKKIATLDDKNIRIIYCLNTYPGHHAMFDGYGGYCFIHNGCVGANQLQKMGLKTAILDLDYHHGNGAEDCSNRLNHSSTDNKNAIPTISIHADPTYEYPSFSGFEHEKGQFGMTTNIIFPKKASWSQYKICLVKALKVLLSHKPDVLIISFGGDTYENDPDPSILYGCCLKLDDYTEMGKLISTTLPNTRFIVTNEGGYNMDAVANITSNFLKGLNTLA